MISKIYKPHDYQLYAINFILMHPIAMIWMQCGLGKTSVTLYSILELMYDYFLISKTLVIAPLRVCRTVWPEEVMAWEQFNGLRVSLVVGSREERLKALKVDADIYVINRDVLDWLVNESGIKPFWDLCVIDEISSFKNSKSKRFKALMSIRQTFTRMIGLTASPSPNSLEELYGEFKLMDYGERLGYRIGQFRNTYFRPAIMNGPIVYKYEPLPGAKEQMYKRIKDITMSLTSADHLKMPDLVSGNIKVKMSVREWKTYEDLKKNLMVSLNDTEVTASNATALCGKLCQMASGAIYSDDGSVINVHEQKLDAMEQHIESMNGNSLIICYWFKHELDRICERLDKLDVTYCKIDTDESIHGFNEGKYQIALAQPSGCGHGINLQKHCNQMLWYSTPFSLELYQQMVARIYRQGNTADTVVIQHLICEKTVDEQIMKALEIKDTTQSALIEAVKADLHM